MTIVSTVCDYISCPVCSAEAKIAYREHPGYKKSKVYDIFCCEHCNTAFANPLKVDSDLYELIYSKPDEIPGYDRYSKYAQAVLTQENPLEYLAKSEEIYWSIKNYFQNTSSSSKNILEVGCGMGYLTYSLIKAGFNVTGLDISMNAIERATARYGEHFVCADLHEYKSQTDIKYDVIILTEVIEHVPNIYEIINSLSGLLADGGEIVITTPNKSPYSKEIIWHTEMPPIHLWWFSETSMVKIADKSGYSVKFTDFSECNSLSVTRQVTDELTWKTSMFDEQGNILLNSTDDSPVRKLKKTMHSTGLLPKIQSLMSKLPVLKEKFIVGERRGILCAVFSKKLA